jgi:hypothetical protein
MWFQYVFIVHLPVIATKLVIVLTKTFLLFNKCRVWVKKTTCYTMLHHMLHYMLR